MQYRFTCCFEWVWNLFSLETQTDWNNFLWGMIWPKRKEVKDWRILYNDNIHDLQFGILPHINVTTDGWHM
jgi:hypothetical protein